MVAPFSGGCLCGAVRYEVSAEPVAFMLCHCRDCQYVSGGEPAAVVVVPARSISILKGGVKGFAVKGESGSDVERQFCPECGTPMFTRLGGMPQLECVKAGTLDDASWLKPTAFLWQKSAQPWAHRDPAIHGYDKGPQPRG
jgi:hypothetical protein